MDLSAAGSDMIVTAMLQKSGQTVKKKLMRRQKLFNGWTQKAKLH